MPDAGTADAGTAGGGAADAGSVDGTWTTLSHTPPLPPPDAYTWQGSPATFEDVWADQEQRVWVVAHQINYKGPATSEVRRWEQGSWQSEPTGFLYSASLSGLTASDLWLAAGGLGIEHENGGTWTPFMEPQAALIWENSAADVWSCCSPSTSDKPGGYQAAHWDGNQWAPVPLPALDGFAPTALFSRSAVDAWIAGTAGFLLHWDGKTWQSMQDATVERWNAVWGDAHDIWTVGAHGAVARWDGVHWKRFPTEAPLKDTIDLADVWGSAPGAIWLVGASGTILRWDGASFHSEPTDVTTSLHAVWGIAGGVVWAVGDEETLLTRKF